MDICQPYQKLKFHYVLGLAMRLFSDRFNHPIGFCMWYIDTEGCVYADKTNKQNPEFKQKIAHKIYILF